MSIVALMASNIIDLSAFPAAEEINIKTIHRETYLLAWQLKDCKAIMNVTTEGLAKKQFCEWFGFGLKKKKKPYKFYTIRRSLMYEQ